MPVHFVPPPKLVIRWEDEYEPRPGAKEYLVMPRGTARLPTPDERDEETPHEFWVKREKGLPKLRRFR